MDPFEKADLSVYSGDLREFLEQVNYDFAHDVSLPDGCEHPLMNAEIPEAIRLFEAGETPSQAVWKILDLEL